MIVRINRKTFKKFFVMQLYIITEFDEIGVRLALLQLFAKSKDHIYWHRCHLVLIYLPAQVLSGNRYSLSTTLARASMGCLLGSQERRAHWRVRVQGRGVMRCVNYNHYFNLNLVLMISIIQSYDH